LLPVSVSNQQDTLASFGPELQPVPAAQNDSYLIQMYWVRHKNNRLRKLKFLENDKAYFDVFFTVNGKVYV